MDKIAWSEFEIVIKHLKVGRATGPDGIPSEVFKYCPEIKNELFHFISYLWDEEVVPQDLVTANCHMLYKNKGSREDPSCYRYIVLSLILPGRMIGISDSFLQDWQAGFREARGCRDNSMILRVLCDKLISIGNSLAVGGVCTLRPSTRFLISLWTVPSRRRVPHQKSVRCVVRFTMQLHRVATPI